MHFGANFYNDPNQIFTPYPVFIFDLTSCCFAKSKCSCFHTAFCEQTGNDTIYYEFNHPLTWKDFQGKIPAGAPWGAMTASGFSFNSSMELRDNVINIYVGVYTFFTKHDSWRKPEAKTPFQLEHEQHHFDITRLGAAKLEDEIKKAHFTAHNYKTLLNFIFNKVYKEEYALQKQYDQETHNSMDSGKQVEWNRKIGSEIAALKKESGAELSSNP